jgi:hypothetical protein
MFRRSVFRFSAGFAVLALGIIAGGCSGRPSESESVQKSLEVNNLAQLPLSKFSGTVTIDGQPPVIDRKHPLYVLAYDPKHPPKGRELPASATCDKNGHFDFSTYGTGDGVPTGSYIVLFAQPSVGSGEGDGLKNLYNDPDKNAKEERFQINLSSPTKTEWTFDLTIAGKDPVTTPGEHALMARKKRR